MRVSMNTYHLAVLLLLATCPITYCRAAENTSQGVPKIVVAGLEAYRTNGADAAIKAWLKGSALEEEKQATSQSANFKQVESYYGSYKSYELVQTKDISKSTRIVYLVMNFQRGPLFASFVCYRTEQDWIIPTFNFNTKPELVYPPSMLTETK